MKIQLTINKNLVTTILGYVTNIQARNDYFIENRITNQEEQTLLQSYSNKNLVDCQRIKELIEELEKIENFSISIGD